MTFLFLENVMEKKKRPGPRKATPGPDGKRRNKKWSLGLGDEICRRIASGAPWLQICNTDVLPCYDSLNRWQKKYPDFAEKLKAAREFAARNRAELALQVAQQATVATVQRDRLEVNTLLWHATHGAPHLYGKAPPAPKAEPKVKRIIVEVRDWIPFTLPDGRVIAREIRPDGSFIDE
jgi:hypothetical protein